MRKGVIVMDFSGKTTEELRHLLDEIQKELAKRERCSGLKFFSNVHDMMRAGKENIKLIVLCFTK